MNPEELLQKLRSEGIELWSEGRKLNYRAPVGDLTPNLRAVLKKCKKELIELLDHQGSIRELQKGLNPLSFAQKRIWFFEQLISGTHVYNVNCTFRITGTLNVYALKESINEIIRRHSILRSKCITSNDKPLQQIVPELEFQLCTIDLSGEDGFNRSKNVIDLATKEVQRPFNLLNAPLFRATLIKVDSQIHILVLVTHHFVMDGYSLRSVFMKELSKLYEAFASGKSSPLKALPMQFHNYIEMEQRMEASGQLNSLFEYWRQKLEGIPKLIQLPTDRSRPLITTYKGTVQRFTIREPLSEDVKALSRKNNASLFMTYLAAFQALLYRYTNETNIVMGTTVSYRPFLETEDLIGPMANNLVLVADFAGDPTFKQVIQQVYKISTEAYSHQELPFERLVEALRPDRNLDHNPLFQILFMFHENSRGANFHLKGTTSEWLPIDPGSSRFDLSLELENVVNGVDGSIEYNTDLYSSKTIDFLMKHYLKLLRCIADEPGLRISEIDFLTDIERKDMISAVDTGDAGIRSKVCLHKLFETQTTKNPGATAVICGSENMTFYQLNQRANALARHLGELGVGPDKIVGICADRSTSLIVGLMGILKAGGAYLPLDPAYPKQRLSFMIQDAQADILVTQKKLVSNLPKHLNSIVHLEHFDLKETASEIPDPRLDHHASHLAYLIYTSGSTGQPKGVAVEHHSVCSLLNWAKDIWSEHDRSSVLASTSICFDLSVFEIFLPICFGGCVVLVENIFELLSDTNISTRVSLINSTPSIIAELLRSGTIPTSVKSVNLAGERLPKELPEKLYKAGNIRDVYNLYGPTEDTVYSTFYRVPPKETRQPSIGRPIPGTRVFILDQNLNPVPFGVAGELCIGGEGLARGYWNRSELNAEKFIKRSFDGETVLRIYRTGDFARLLSDGNLEYLGRFDEQIKFHGIRLEPSEIESALRDHPDVNDAAVIAKSDSLKNTYLIAYVVAGLEDELKVSELRTFLKLRLPGYMIPSVFLSIESIPLTPNGKLDRQALPEPEKQCPSLGLDYRPPHKAVEKAIAGIWQEVLNLEKVGTHDNFFDLGGHSLLLVQVQAKLKKYLKLNVSLIELFKYPTIYDLATYALRDQMDVSFGMRVYERANKQIKALNQRKLIHMRRRKFHE